jgi:iron complex outermembrane receptor protein
MSNKITKTVLLRSTMLLSVAAFSVDVSGQTVPATTPAANAAAAGAVADAETIVVTGSLIRNANLTNSAPINVTTSDEIKLRQNNTAEELLRDIPGTVSNVGSAVNNGTGGAFFVDLRGIGPNRNIVLLNGGRIVPADLTGQVDLNNIPLALVDRVEVLTGGASTTYGADAVSGVVNFITKQNFTGVELNVSDQITGHGDGMYKRADLTIGGNFADDKGNAVLSVGYQNADPVYQGDRDFGAIALNPIDGTTRGSGSSTTIPAVLAGYGGPTRQISPTGTLVPLYQTFNFNPYNIYQTPFKRYNVFGQAHYEIAPDVQVYTEAMFSKNKVSQIIAPSGTFTNTLQLPLSNPYIPAGVLSSLCTAQGLTPAQCTAASNAKTASDPNFKIINTQIRRRFVEAGTRNDDFTTTLFNVKSGVRGKITEHFDFDVYGAYGQSENVSVSSGQGLFSRLQQSVLATNTTTCLTTTNGCVPINLFGQSGSITPAMLSSIVGVSTFKTTRDTLAQAHGQVSGDLGFSSPFANAPVSVAVGAEYRDYFAQTQADAATQTPGEVLGAGAPSPDVSGRYSVYELFSEIIAPVVQDRPGISLLQLEGGYRYSRYSISGGGAFSTSTYKGGVQYEPVAGLKFRGNYNRAVRSPNIGELFNPPVGNLGSLQTDPCATFNSAGVAKTGQPLGSPGTNANLSLICIAQGSPAAQVNLIQDPSAAQPNTTTGGNRLLHPEKADTYTAGVVFQPKFVRGFTISADYYHILVRDAITNPSENDIISACFGAAQNPGLAVTPACTAIRRSTLTGGLDGSPGNPPGLPLVLSNLGRIETNGVDLVANYSRDVGLFKLGLNFNANYTFHNKFKSSPTSINRDCVGLYGVSCASIQPKFSFNQRTTLGFSNFDISVLWRHLSGENVESDDANGNQVSGAAAGFYGPFSHIKSYDYFDLTGRVVITENLDLTLTVQNLADRRPPVVGQNIGATAFNSGNTYPSTYDALGRRFAFSARIRY